MEEDFATAEAKPNKTDEQSKAQDVNMMEVTSESQPEDQVASAGAQEKGKAKEQPVDDAQAMDIAIEHQPEVACLTEMEEGKGKDKESEIKDQQEIQDAVPGPAGELALLAQDPRSETFSITASSISNPALEVDNSVSTICSWA